MGKKLNITGVLKKVDIVEQELIRLRRDIIYTLVVQGRPEKCKPSLFGSVNSGDVTEEMIEESKANLFRKLDEL